MKKCILVIVLLAVIFVRQAGAGLSFLKTTVILTEEKEDVLLKQRFYSEGEQLRIDEESSGIEGNPGIRIYDLKKKKLYTIMLDVKLYMEQDIEVEKESLMFEIPPEQKYSNYSDLKVLKTKQGEETIGGHPALRYEIKVVRKAEKGKEKEEQVLERYILWAAKDLNEMPVKYEFEFPNNKKKIINYTEINTETVDPSLFTLPEGYTPISPF